MIYFENIICSSSFVHKITHDITYIYPKSSCCELNKVCEGRAKKIRAWVVKSSTTITLVHQSKGERKNQPIKLLCALKFTCDHFSLNINEHFLLQIGK
jgi:hypothetical protein